MPRRLLPLLAAVALVLVAATGCASEVSPAATVGGHKISDSDLLDDVGEWAHNPAAFDPDHLKGLNPGTYPMRLVDVILQQRIELDLHAQEFRRRKLRLTDEIRQAALAQLFQGDLSVAQQALRGFSTGYAKRYVDDIGEQLAVQDALGQAGYLTWRTRAYAKADISVSPRYGHWDAAQQTVVAPAGPTQPAGLRVPL